MNVTEHNKSAVNKKGYSYGTKLAYEKVFKFVLSYAMESPQ